VVAGLDVAAVAELVGKKPGTVRVAVHRALKSLSRRYDGPGGPVGPVGPVGPARGSRGGVR
jgi:DNA-directed RNA polymerase specialized sigma24 family protein